MDNSPLGKLPAEIRTYIYELVLCHEQGVVIDIDQGALRLNSPSASSYPLALPSTCHQMRSESIEIFWKENHFRFAIWAFNEVLEPREMQQVDAVGERWPSIMDSWLVGIGEAARYIKSVDFDLGFWNTNRREQNELGCQYIAPQLAKLQRRWCGAESSLRFTIYVQPSFNVNIKNLFGLRVGLGVVDLNKAEACVRAGDFDCQRSIAYKDALLEESVCAYGFYGKKIFPVTQNALLSFLDALRDSNGPGARS